jgi:hypothetical protein
MRTPTCSRSIRIILVATIAGAMLVGSAPAALAQPQPITLAPGAVRIDLPSLRVPLPELPIL